MLKDYTGQANNIKINFLSGGSLNINRSEIVEIKMHEYNESVDIHLEFIRDSQNVLEKLIKRHDVSSIVVYNSHGDIVSCVEFSLGSKKFNYRMALTVGTDSAILNIG